MTTFAVDPAITRHAANHAFFVANWPEGLQRASQRERELLGLMSHPCYRLIVRRGEDGFERLVVRPSPGMPSPVTEEARTHIQMHRTQIIAFVKHRDAVNQKLREVSA